MKKIPYGITDYEELITNNYIYIDKTMYIKEIEECPLAETFYRPKGFGKSLFISMMYYYYDINSKDKFDILFKDTYVYNNQTPERNSYYVLKFDFSGMNTKNRDKELFAEDFKNRVINGLNQFKEHYNLDIEIEDYKYPSEILMMFLGRIDEDKRLYVMVDDYDSISNSFLEGNADMFNEILNKEGYIKSFYEVIKEYCGSIIDRIFMPGVCYVNLNSFTSGFNIALDLTNYGFLNEMMGFSVDEVKTLISDIDSNKQEEVLNTMIEYYGGYKFDDEVENTVLNARQVMYFLDYYYKHNEVPKELFNSDIASNYKELENILTINNNKYTKYVLEKLVNNDKLLMLYKTYNYSADLSVDSEDIITLLNFFGYLTMDSRTITRTLEFKVPNKVIDAIINECYQNMK